MLLDAEGILHFDRNQYTNKQKAQDWKRYAVCELSCDIDAYYRWFIQRRFNLILLPTLRDAHVSVINDMVGRDLSEEGYQRAMKKYDGKVMRFKYDISPKSNGEYWWLKVYSDDLLEIRREAGLGRPFFGQHLTIGYPHPRHEDHSKYILDQCLKYNL